MKDKGFEVILQKLHGKRVRLLIDAVLPDPDNGVATWEQEGVLYYELGAVKLVSAVRTYYINVDYIIAVWEDKE